MTFPGHLRRYALVSSLLCSALFACSSDDAGENGASGPTGPVLRGRIVDSSGQPVAGVKVSVGSQSASSGADGHYTVKGRGGEVVVRFSKTGYVDGLERLTIGSQTTTQLDAILLTSATPVTMSAEAGGEIAGARGVKVTVPPSALIDSTGAIVTGSVDVVLTPIDPSKSAEVRGAPGDFRAASAGQPTMLESFGMVDISIRRGEEKLQVAPGKDLELRIPVPEATASPPATMPLWSFDEAKGLWIDEGIAQYDAASRTYVAKAKHMSFWNCDQPYLATCVCGQVKDRNGGTALGGARVVASGTTYFGTSEATTGDDGKFCIAVRKDSGVNVAAYHKSGGGQSRQIQSGSADTSVPPAAGDARCVDIGTWEVEKDVYIAADGSRQSCNSVAGIFANTCASRLGEQIGSCFNPSGDCTIKSNGEIVYGNGSRMTSSADGVVLYGPDGAECATIEGVGGQTDPNSFVSRYRLPSGEIYEFTIDSNTGSFSVRCPDGQTVSLSAEQQTAISACSANEGSSGGDGSEGICKFEGIDGGDDRNIGATCENDDACTGGIICCQIDQTKMCYPKDACDAIRESEQ